MTMVASPHRKYITAQEYLNWEEQQPIKYEYFNDEVFATGGGTIPHNDIALNLALALKRHLPGKGCKVQIADVKVGVSEQILIECFRLNENGFWELHSYTEAETVHFASIDFDCPIETLYEDVELEF